MDVSDVPAWAQSVGAVFGTGVVAAWLTLKERKKAKAAPVESSAEPAQIVAASFVERRLMEDLTTAIKGLHGTVLTLSGHVEKLNERMHEEEIVRAAVAKIKEQGRV